MSGLDSLYGAEFVRRISRNANVVVAFENNLNVAKVESITVTNFGKLAGGGDDVIDEFIGDFEKSLQMTSISMNTHYK